MKFARRRVYLWVALDPDSRALICLHERREELGRDLRVPEGATQRRGVRRVITDKEGGTGVQQLKQGLSTLP